MNYLTILFGIAAIQLLAAASPGPTFLVVSRYSVGESRQRGLWVVFGVLLADFIWTSLAACGISTFVNHYPAIYRVMQIAGAIYLIWLGSKILINLANDTQSASIAKSSASAISHAHAVREGMVTNMTNPKSIAYYTSLFAAVIPSRSPVWLLIATVATALLVSTLWWLAVVFFFALSRVRRTYNALRNYIEATVGGVLILLGARLGLLR